MGECCAARECQGNAADTAAPAEGLRLREGDQPLPTPNDLPEIADLVIAEIDKRRRLGVQRYGTALQAFNGRDPLRDALDECLDLAQYLTQAMHERDHAPRAIADPDAPPPAAPQQRPTRCVRLEARAGGGRYELMDMHRASWDDLYRRAPRGAELRATLARLLGFYGDPETVEITVFDLPDVPALHFAATAPALPPYRPLYLGERL